MAEQPPILIPSRRKVEHLYFHVPFCPQLCDYCSFYSEKGDLALIRRFVRCLVREVELASEHFEFRPRTIFFGGGTPSALSVSQMEALFAGLEPVLDLGHPELEFTLEMNPATVSADKARLLRAHGVNRISMGVQAFDDPTLKMLNRVHDAAQVHRSYDILRAAGFDNVNLDLMFAVPGQTLDQWERTLRQGLALAPEHLSCYCLTYEEDTEFWRRHAEGIYRSDEGVEAEMFQRTVEWTAEEGYAQYEISNFSRPGRECAHNLAYWRARDYFGFGPSAFGTVGELRYQNIADTGRYCDRVEAGECLHAMTEHVTPELRRKERVMFGLRTAEGVSDAELGGWMRELDPFLESGHVERMGGRYRLTPEGRLFADEIASVFA